MSNTGRRSEDAQECEHTWLDVRQCGTYELLRQVCSDCGAYREAPDWKSQHDSEGGWSPNFQKSMAGIDRQNEEFDKLIKLHKTFEDLRRVPVVDDYYPEVRHYYECAFQDFMKAVVQNRVDPKSTWAGMCHAFAAYKAQSEATVNRDVEG